MIRSVCFWTEIYLDLALNFKRFVFQLGVFFYYHTEFIRNLCSSGTYFVDSVLLYLWLFYALYLQAHECCIIYLVLDITSDICMWRKYNFLLKHLLLAKEMTEWVFKILTIYVIFIGCKLLFVNFFEHNIQSSLTFIKGYLFTKKNPLQIDY